MQFDRQFDRGSRRRATVWGPGRPGRGRAVPALVAALALAGCTGGGAQTGPGAGGSSAGAITPRTLNPAAGTGGGPSPAPAAAGSGVGGSSGASAPAAGAPAPLPGARDAGVFGRIPEIVAQVEPSVVTVVLPGGVGSGVVWNADGIIVTNEHVVRPALDRNIREVQVAFADGRRSPATIRATDRFTDLAIVQTERRDLPPARFQTALPQVGELAVTLGSPLGFERTAAAGIVSGLHRDIPGSAQDPDQPPLVDLIQTDAAISPGNSGGALINARGEVIGINDAYIPPQVGAVALGFAIPGATVQNVVQQLLETGQARHAFLGVNLRPITPQIAGRLGQEEGVGVSGVEPSGPAERAGVRPGDVIAAIDGQAVDSVEEFLGRLRPKRPGDRITVDVVRDGQRVPLQVTVGERPAPPGR